MVVAIKSIYDPIKVLKIISIIENDMGRIRKKKWDSRTIDIDILFFDKQIIKTKELIIPHKHLDQRMFVLRPLADIAPFFIHPESKKNIKQLIKECKDDSKVFEYEL
jgi:2-amino-4-hydroxy-6-hydroxymethyldihydropteridine diphosphokinase